MNISFEQIYRILSSDKSNSNINNDNNSEGEEVDEQDLTIGDKKNREKPVERSVSSDNNDQLVGSSSNWQPLEGDTFDKEELTSSCEQANIEQLREHTSHNNTHYNIDNSTSDKEESDHNSDVIIDTHNKATNNENTYNDNTKNDNAHNSHNDSNSDNSNNNNSNNNNSNNSNNNNSDNNNNNNNNSNNINNNNSSAMDENTGSRSNVIEMMRENSIDSEAGGDDDCIDFENILNDIYSYGEETEEELEDVIDPFCDPAKPVKVPFQEVSAAAFMVKGGIERTPCDRSRMSETLGMSLYFKKDFLQYTGSFKERGACYTLMSLTRRQKKMGVIAASAGNHALGLAYHGKRLNVPVIVVMPKHAPLMKQELCKQLGAHVVVHGIDFGVTKKFAMAMSKKHDILYINGYDHPLILAGQGTMGIEIAEQVPDLDAVIIPIGGGGLGAGVALALKSLKPRVKIYGVESEKAAGFAGALKAGKPVFVEVQPTLADGLAVPVVGVNAFATLKPLLDKMIVVHEEYIALAILRLIEMEKCVVEGAGATGLAAILSNAVPELKGKKVVCILCGGNIDTTVLGRVLERGLATDGRICRFAVNVSDRPGGIAELTRLIASVGVSLKDIFHERAWLKSDVFSVQVRCVVETRNKEHFLELKNLLRQNYGTVYFGDEYKHGFI